MRDFWLDVAKNFIANFLFWIVLGIVFYLFLLRRIKRINNFFGTSKEDSIVIYFSSVIISNIGVHSDIKGLEEGTYGSYISEQEFQIIPMISKTFSIDIFERMPDVSAGLVDKLWRVKLPRIAYEVSPKNQTYIKKGNTICIGGPAYNLVTRYYLRTLSPFFIYVDNNNDDFSGKSIKINRGNRAGEIIDLKADEDIGIIQKITDHDSNIIFILAGLGLNGTEAAFRYLLSNWELLYKNYSKNEFGIYIKCIKTSIRENGYEYHREVYKIPEFIR